MVALVLAGYRRRTLPVSTAMGDIEIHVGDFDNSAVRTALDKLATGSTLPGCFSQVLSLWWRWAVPKKCPKIGEFGACRMLFLGFFCSAFGKNWGAPKCPNSPNSGLKSQSECCKTYGLPRQPQQCASG